MIKKPQPPPEKLLCYLCGSTLDEDISRDHVPPLQLYADEIRKKHQLNLRTIRVHSKCNKSYQYDEDYFVNTLAPFAHGSYAGNAFLEEVFAKYRTGIKKGLVEKVRKEFHRQPGGILLPQGLVAKHIEGARVHRVAWKIIRGLYFYERGKLLPENTPNNLEIVPPNRSPGDHFYLLPDEPVRGQYPGVFNYKYARFEDLNDFECWAMILWDRLILIMGFHSPTCKCEVCGGDNGDDRVGSE